MNQIMSAGTPKKFLSDRGSGFIGNKFKKFLRNAGVHQLMTSTQRPQCNGMNERTNQTIINRLRCKIDSISTKAWPSLLRDVVTEYNNTPHEVTGFSPAFLMFGTRPYEPILHSQPIALEEARQKAFERTQSHHVKNKIIYDKRFIPQEFQPGDDVLVEVHWHPNNGKLTPAMEGPYKILTKLSDVSYEINRPIRPMNRQTDIVHISKLRKYYNPGDVIFVAGECNAPLFATAPHNSPAIQSPQQRLIKGNIKSANTSVDSQHSISYDLDSLFM